MPQGDFPEEGYEDGFIADGYMRRHLTREGFKRLAGVRPDDLFVYTDGDELVHPEILVRLIFNRQEPSPHKFIDRYPSPIIKRAKMRIFGYGKLGRKVRFN